MGKLTIIEGDPGLGKSQLTLAIAAALSRGMPLPGGEQPSEPHRVLLMTAEDGLADTVRPRLEDAEADLHNVKVLTCMLTKEGKTKFITFENLDVIEAGILEQKPALVIIDPIIAFTGKADTHKANEVRGFLAPLAALAEKHGCAVVAIRHLNKGNMKVAYRGQGSIDFLAACRSAFLVGKNPENPAERVFSAYEIKSRS